MKNITKKYEEMGREQQQQQLVDIENLSDKDKKRIIEVLGMGILFSPKKESITEYIAKNATTEDITKMSKMGYMIKTKNGRITEISVPLTESITKTDTEKKEGDKNPSKKNPFEELGLDMVK